MNNEIENSLRQAAQVYHKNNPHVFNLFTSLALSVIRTGRKCGAKLIFEQIRWHYLIQSTGEKFKLNNNYAKYFAEMFIKSYPEHTGFFKFRERFTDAV